MASKKRQRINPRQQPETGLTPSQERAAGMLAAGCKNAAVLSALSIAQSTLTKWQAQPDFQELLQQLTDIQRDEVRRTLRQASAEVADNLRTAIATISEMMGNESLPARDRIAASGLAVRMAERMMGIASTEPEPTGADYTPEQLKDIRERVYGIASKEESAVVA